MPPSLSLKTAHRPITNPTHSHKYLTLPLIPLEDFLTLYPQHATPETTEDEVMIARIKHEHEEREQLEQARQELLKKKQALIAENKKRKEDLAALDADLEKFIEAAEPIQRTFEREY
jgi:THO complex subunit 5